MGGGGWGVVVVVGGLGWVWGGVIQRLDDRSLVEVTLHSGRNRIVRRMFDAVGYPVLDLVRTSIGPISLGNLKPGQVDEVRGAQLRSLYTAVGL